MTAPNQTTPAPGPEWSDAEFEALTRARAALASEKQAAILRDFYGQHGAAPTLALAMAAMPPPSTAAVWAELITSWMRRDVASTWPSTTAAAKRWADRADQKRIERVAFFVFSKLPTERRKALIAAVEAAEKEGKNET